MRKLLKVLGVFTILMAVAYASGFKQFSWNAMLFGTGSGIRSIQFDKVVDGNTAIIQVDPADEYFNFNNLTKFNGSFQAFSTTIPSRPCPAMTEAQRDLIGSPADGDCIYNTDANQLNTYNATAVAWVSAGSGGGGGLDVFFEETFELTKVTDLDSGNNASFLGGGSIVGTVAYESSTPIAGDNSLKYTQASGSLNDYVSTPVINIDPKVANGNSVGITVYFTYDGDSDDVRLILYDDTNDVIITSELDKVTSETDSARYSSSAIVPVGVTELRFGFQTVVENIGAILVIDDIELSTNPFIYKNIITEQSYQVEQGGSSLTNRGSEIEFNLGTATITNMGEGLIVAEDDSANTRTKFVATQDVTLVISVTGKPDTATKGMAIGKNGTPIIYGNVVGANDLSIASGSIRLSKGEYFTVGVAEVESFPVIFNNNIQNDAGLVNLILTAQATSEHVVTPTKNSATDYVTQNTITIEGTTTDPTKPTVVDQDSIIWKRDGSNVNATYKYYASSTTGGVAGSGDYLYSLPTGMEFADSVEYYTDVEGSGYWEIKESQIIGHASTTDGTFASIGQAVPYDSTRFRIAYNYISGGGYSSSSYAHLGVAKHIAIKIDAPIKGWTALGEFLSAVPPQKTAYIKHQVANNVASGTFTGGAWQTRPLTTLSGDNEFVSLSTNQFTLAKGVYEIEATASTYYVNWHRLKIRNITDSSDSILGQSAIAPDGPTYAIGTSATLRGRIEILETKTFELQHRSSKTQATNGFGYTTNFGVDEIYAEIKITKTR